MNEKKTYSVVIRSYNEGKYISRLLESLKTQTVGLESLEVILVDSGSTDETVEIAEEYGTKIVQIAKEDFSFGYALNQGILAAAGDYILMISAHCYPVHDNWIAEMTRPFVDPKVALVYGKQEGNEVSRYSETRLMKQWFPSTSFSRQKSPFCNNANSAIPKKLWEEMKYNEELTGLEDLDWAQKTIEKGFHLYYNADASIIHVHEEGFKQIYNRYRREAITLKQIYKEASFSLWDFVSLSAANISSDLMAAKSERAFLKFFSEIFLFRLCQFWGTFQGYRLSKNISPDLRERFYYPPSRD